MFVDTEETTGLLRVAPAVAAVGPMITARARAESDRTSAAR